MTITFFQFPKICKKMKNHAFEIWVQFFLLQTLFLKLGFALFYRDFPAEEFQRARYF